MKEGEQKLFMVCLDCGHRWSGKGKNTPRQCPQCWSYSIVDEKDIRLAGIFLRPTASIIFEKDLPKATETNVIPIGGIKFSEIISRARNLEAKRRALYLILSEAGLTDGEITKYIRMSAL